jgi:endonuclease G, mitochondrial
MARDLHRALERALGTDTSAASRRTADLPPVATGFQSCSAHFYRGSPPVLDMPKAAATYGPLRALCYDQFAVLHAGALKGPLFSAERLNAEALREGASVKRPDGRKAFFADARLPARERAQLEDYAGESRLPKEERHDRGHLTPARDMRDDRAMAQSFSLANVVPQNSINNQQAWNKIEKDTRAYVMRASGTVTIITGAYYAASPARLGGDGPAIPSALYKLVHDDSTGRSWAHWLPNTATARIERPISYDELVKRTGIRFLPTNG